MPFLQKRDGPTDGPTDRRTDRPTDTPSYRDARTHLKTFVSDILDKSVTDGPTGGPTDGSTDTSSYRYTRMFLKIKANMKPQVNRGKAVLRTAVRTDLATQLGRFFLLFQPTGTSASFKTQTAIYLRCKTSWVMNQ